MTPKIVLEFQDKQRPVWVGWAMLAIALFVAVDVNVRKSELEEQLAVWRAPRVAAVPVATRESVRQGAAPPIEEQMREASAVLEQLALPWSPLFGSIERAHTDTVALLAIQPDAQRRSVMLIGEAKGYVDVLTYVARLRDEARLTNVYLVGNELKEDHPQRPVTFTVSADWRSLQ